MHQYLRHAPARRLTSGKSGVGKLWLVALVVLGLMAFTQAAYASLIMKFDQSSYSGAMWLQVQDPQFGTGDNFQATYANGTKSIDFSDGGNQVLMSQPVKLSEIGAAGLNITHADSVLIFLFYDDPTGNSRTASPAFMTSTQRFQNFELTMKGGAGDYGNLTAINYFTATQSIRSYDASQNLLQQAGWGSSTSQLGAQFATASGGNSQVVVKNAQGNIIRYLGPSDFPSANPWPSFIPYTQSINQAGQSTTIQPNAQGFYFPPELTPVYQFGFDMTATASADGSLTVTGDITASVNGTIKPGNPALPPGGVWTGATLSFSTADPDAFNSAIYGSVQTSAVTTTGTAWDEFKTFTQSTLMDPTQPHDINTNPSLYDYVAGAPLNAYNTALNNLIGEVSTGLLGGFFNSDYLVGGVAIKNMASNQWWALDPMVAFATIQPLHPYYDAYSGVVFNDSQNTVYGVPYSDRFQHASNSPAVYTVQYTDAQHVTHDVASWVIGFGAPLGTKALTGMLQLLLLE
jgi:hypothetical protein